MAIEGCRDAQAMPDAQVMSPLTALTLVYLISGLTVVAMLVGVLVARWRRRRRGDGGQR